MYGEVEQFQIMRLIYKKIERKVCMIKEILYHLFYMESVEQSATKYHKNLFQLKEKIIRYDV